jgi:hypothetical protein
VRRARKGGIAAPAASAFGDDELLVAADEVSQHRAGVGIPYYGARWDLNNDARAGAAILVFAAAVLATSSLEVLAAPESDQGIELRVYGEDHITAAPTAPATGATARNVFFATEGDHAVAAVAGLDLNGRLVK